jgi:hypothetical protein
MMKTKILVLWIVLLLRCESLPAEQPLPPFKVIAFYTGKNDQAHISFVRVANVWFAKTSAAANFIYRSTTNGADPASFPLGTGPKPHEIWHSGYYPVVWTHKRYRMLYLNMGHNDIDYQTKPPTDLSSTFESEIQNRLVFDSLLWLAGRKQ